MATQMIELECPQCKTMLELDSGFAGGVCRCSNCGTLMTVPADPSRERAETLTRPERPDAPGSPARAPAPVGGGRPEVPGQPAAAPTPATPAAPADTEIYTTASGKTIRVKKASIVTAKTKRKAIRASIIVIFVAFMALILGGTAIAVVMMMKPKPVVGTSEEEIKSAMGGYDPAINPFTAKGSNFLGIPLRKTAVIAIDSSSTSRIWISVVKDSAGFSATHLAPDAKIQLILWQEQGAAAYPDDGPKSTTDKDREAITAFLEGHPARGDAQPGPSLAKALEANPDQIVMVVGKQLDKEQIAKLGEMFKEKSSGRLDVIMISDDQNELKTLAKDHGGVFVSLPANQIIKWYRDMPEPDAAGDQDK